MVVIREPQTRFLLALRCRWEFEAWIEFIIRSNASLADNKIKNEIEQSLSK